MVDPVVIQRVQSYASLANVIINASPRAFGDDGAIWDTSRRTILKAFYREANFVHELECYQRLSLSAIRKIREFDVPELINYDNSRWIIEIGFVSPPYILDFGKAYLADPKFPDHVVQEWNERMEFWWGDEVKRVRLALFALRQYGIWYYDAKPGNVMLEHWNPKLDD